MARFQLQVRMVVATMAAFFAVLALSEWLFPHELEAGINYIYLPAGVRLLCTLLFAEAGALGLLLASWLVCFTYLFPDDPLRAFMGGILASAAPYGAYRLGQNWYGIGASLASLTPKRLLVLSAVYSVASPVLHHLWFAISSEPSTFAGFVTMMVGDLIGTLIVIYAVKCVLSLVPRQRP